MGIKYSFIDSTVYGTDDINDITKSLTGAGVAPFVSKDSYNATDLNVLTSALVESGVQLDGCRCTVYNPGTAEMTVTVAQGIIFFQSGVRLTVDEQGYTIAAVPNTAGYIYAHYSTSLQKADIVLDTELPTDGEYVLLATLDEAGKITDTRTFAQSKIATIGKNVALKREFTKLDNPILLEEGKYIAAKVEGVDMSRYNYAQICTGGIFSGSNGTAIPTLGTFMVFFNINNNEIEYGAEFGDIWKATRFYYTGGGRWVFDPEVIGGELCLICRCTTENASGIKDYTPNSVALLM